MKHLWIGLLVLASCKQEPIVTYRVPKESVAPAAAPVAATSHVELDWKLPSGWIEQPPSNMRVGSFKIMSKIGGSVDVSIVALAGDAGGDLANVNRWRGQIGLDPIAGSDLAAKSEMISAAGQRMRLVNFENSGKRLVAVACAHDGKTWFFKMTGDDAAVEAALPSFRTFLSSLKFHEHS